MEQATPRDTSREQIATRFIDFPPEPPCILALFEVLKPPLFGLNSKAQDDHDLCKEKTDHQTEDAANPVRPEQGHGQERRKDRCTAAKGVADPRCPQAHFRGEQFRNVNRKERGDQDINGNGQQEADRDQSRRLMDERMNAAGHNREQERPDDRGLAPRSLQRKLRWPTRVARRAT